MCVWRAVCFNIPERQSFKAPERQSSEAPKRQSSRASECDTLFFHKFFSRWWIRTSCLVVCRYHHMVASSQALPALKVAIDDECSAAGIRKL